VNRNAVLRWAAPAVFLAALTIAVLLVRSGLHPDAGTTTTTAAIPGRTSSVSLTVTSPRGPKTPRTKQYYTVQSGDTYGSIATKYGTTVTDLQQLNPGISSNSLSVGQKIRIK
jgi:LysM repeat protein